MTAALAPIQLGRCVMTAGVAALVGAEPVVSLMIARWLGQHARNDCPSLSDHDRQANDDAIRDGDRVVTSWAVKTSDDEIKLFVITEWDRLLTTVLRADEY